MLFSVYAALHRQLVSYTRAKHLSEHLIIDIDDTQCKQSLLHVSFVCTFCRQRLLELNYQYHTHVIVTVSELGMIRTLFSLDAGPVRLHPAMPTACYYCWQYPLLAPSVRCPQMAWGYRVITNECGIIVINTNESWVSTKGYTKLSRPWRQHADSPWPHASVQA